MKEIVGKEIASRVKSGDVIGVGTGTTVDAALSAIGERVRKEKLNISVVPTSYQSAWRCEEIGLTVLYPGFKGELSWGFDGADAVDRKLRVIKGKGGAMLKEKILAAKCRHYVIIADTSKVTDDICGKCRIPVETIPEALSVTWKGLERLGASELVIRQGVAKHGPVITEAGNLILDVKFSKLTDTLEKDINGIVGVVENGLFLSWAHEILVADERGIEKLARG